MRRGHILIELLVSLIVISLIGAGLFQFFTTSHLSQEVTRSGNMAITEGRQPIDVVSDHIRNAQQYTTDNVVYSVIHSASATSITYYADEAGATVQYALNAGNLERTDASGTTVVMGYVTALNFKYYLAPSGTTYYSTDLVLGDPSTFGLTERSRIAMVEVSGTVAVNGISRSFKSEIRLRNSPRKVRL